MSVADTKPEPIRVGVEGIAPKPIELTPKPVNWGRLYGLPAFGMFVGERYCGRAPNPSSEVCADYCDWHEQKGYWPHETPMGELKEP